jgi:hypothetical protein
MIEVRELEGKGKGIVATKFIKAGTAVHRELPLMHLTASFIELYRGNTQTGTEKLVAAMSFFRKQMNPHEQERYLSLFGGHIRGPHADHVRKFVEDATFVLDGKPATKAEKDMFVKVVLVSNFNAFGDDNEIRAASVIHAIPTVRAISTDPRSRYEPSDQCKQERSLHWITTVTADCSPLT